VVVPSAILAYLSLKSNMTLTHRHHSCVLSTVAHLSLQKLVYLRRWHLPMESGAIPP